MFKPNPCLGCFFVESNTCQGSFSHKFGIVAEGYWKLIHVDTYSIQIWMPPTNQIILELVLHDTFPQFACPELFWPLMCWISKELFITVHLCSRQRPPWTSPPQVFTSVHLFKKFVGSRFTISSPRFQNNWVKIHRRKNGIGQDSLRWNFCYGQDSPHCRKKWPHI